MHYWELFAWWGFIFAPVSPSQPFLSSPLDNRVIIGLALGAPLNVANQIAILLRGAVLTRLVSFASFAATGYQDPIRFAAGIVYGALIDVWLTRPK